MRKITTMLLVAIAAIAGLYAGFDPMDVRGGTEHIVLHYEIKDNGGSFRILNRYILDKKNWIIAIDTGAEVLEFDAVADHESETIRPVEDIELFQSLMEDSSIKKYITITDPNNPYHVLDLGYITA